MTKLLPLLTGLLLLSGCWKQDRQSPPARETSQAPAALTPRPPPTPLAEPRRPIDPKSIEAAGQVVQHYGALIEQGRWKEAAGLWNSAETAAQFERELSSPAAHLEIGDLSEPEGAAGSIYVTMPVTFTLAGGRGGPVRRAATVTLRRVNDVPGSTEAQRRWHIDRIEWTPRR